jgi:hypothetical protein
VKLPNRKINHEAHEEHEGCSAESAVKNCLINVTHCCLVSMDCRFHSWVELEIVWMINGLMNSFGALRKKN